MSRLPLTNGHSRSTPRHWDESIPLARVARVPQLSLSAYENRRRTPSPEVAERVTQALQGRPSERLREHRDEVRVTIATQANTMSPGGRINAGDQGRGQFGVEVAARR